MKSQLFRMIMIVLFVLLISSYAYGVRYDGPYKGRVIDADTREPIEGVVVLGIWSREHISPGGAVHTFYDAMETVTDKNGDFEIKGLGLLVLSNVIPMDVLIFKAGYEYIGMGSWKGLKSVGWKGKEESYDPTLKTKVIKPVYDPRRKVKWEGDKAIIPLKKLTMEERRKQSTPSFPSEAYEKKKMPLLIKEINKEEKFFGRQPYPEE